MVFTPFDKTVKSLTNDSSSFCGWFSSIGRSLLQ